MDTAGQLQSNAGEVRTTEGPPSAAEEHASRAQSDNAETARESTVVEILIRRPLSRGALFIIVTNVSLLLLGFLVIVAATLARFGNFWSVVASMAFFVLLGILLYRVRNRLAVRRVVKLIHNNRDLIVQRDYAELLTRCAGPARGRTNAYAIQLLSATLPRLGAWNFTARIAPATSQFPISPIVVPFEPVPLDALASWKIDDAPTTQIDTRRARSTAAVQGHGGGLLTRAMQSGWAGVAFVALLWSPGLYDFVRFGRVDVAFVLMSAFLLLAFRRAAFQKAHAASGQVFVVPGGLVFRSRAAGQSAAPPDPELELDPPGLHVFDRRTGALVATQMTGNSWIVVVADISDEVKLDMNTLELNRLLAAWLSPLQPPEISQLSDLA